MCYQTSIADTLHCIIHAALECFERTRRVFEVAGPQASEAVLHAGFPGREFGDEPSNMRESRVRTGVDIVQAGAC